MPPISEKALRRAELRHRLASVPAGAWTIETLAVLIIVVAAAADGYVQALLLEIGAALALVVPLVLLERTLEDRVVERATIAARASVGEARAAMEGWRRLGRMPGTSELLHVEGAREAEPHVPTVDDMFDKSTAKFLDPAYLEERFQSGKVKRFDGERWVPVDIAEWEETAD